MKRQLRSSFLLLAVGRLCLSSDPSIEQQLQSGICGWNPIYGLIPMKFGYDIRSYTSNALEKARKGEIFQYTCNENTSILLFGKDKEHLTYPDQFDTPFPTSKKYLDDKVTFFDNFAEFDREERTGLRTDEKSNRFNSLVDASKKELEKGGNETVDVRKHIECIFQAVGAITEELAHPQRAIISDYSEYLKTSEFRASMSSHLRLYELSFKKVEHLQLQDDFVKAYKALPSSYISNPKPFVTFMESYGTHYIYKAQFGGRIEYSTKHPITQQRTSAKQEIREGYADWIKQYGKKDSETGLGFEEKIDEKMVESEAIGGSISLPVLPPSYWNIEAWEKSVYEIPSPIEVSMIPIIDLIPDINIQTQLALAIVHSVNKKSVERYRELMRIAINKDSLPTDVLNIKGIDSYDEFSSNYSKNFDQVNDLLKDISVHTEAMLTKCTKDVHDKVINLTINYQNVMAIAELMKQMTLHNDIYAPTILIHKLYKSGTFYANDNGFGDTDYYQKQYNAAKVLINSLINDRQTINVHDELNEYLHILKKGNAKLNLKTSDCEDIARKKQKALCYNFTVCKVRQYTNAWSNDTASDEYVDRDIAMKNLKTMLSTMQHTETWEETTKNLEKLDWKGCQHFV